METIPGKTESGMERRQPPNRKVYVCVCVYAQKCVEISTGLIQNAFGLECHSYHRSDEEQSAAVNTEPGLCRQCAPK